MRTSHAGLEMLPLALVVVPLVTLVVALVVALMLVLVVVVVVLHLDLLLLAKRPDAELLGHAAQQHHRRNRAEDDEELLLARRLPGHAQQVRRGRAELRAGEAVRVDAQRVAARREGVACIRRPVPAAALKSAK